MDVQLGCCWRCENPIEKEVPCDVCGEAKYCSELCRFRDQWRHTPECVEWRPKQCSNPKCGKVSGQHRECSACCDAWYCGETCQRQHWKDHKPSCQKRTQKIREVGELLKVKFQNLSSGSGMRMKSPHYVGNTLAIDMLNLPGNELSKEDVGSAKTSEQDPLESSYCILSAGCGNLRNWIHTVASLPNEFKGTLHTVLNDCDIFVQARNVLQLYMMIMYSDDPNIAERITTIWYSLHLPEEDYKFLIDCLRALLGSSADSLDKLTGGALNLSETDMTDMRQVWAAWLELECRKGHPNYINLQEQRKRLLYQYEEMKNEMRMYRKELPNELLPSFDEYDKHGNFVPCANAKSRNLQYDNPTLTGYMFAHSQSQATDLEFLLILMSGRFVYCIEYQLMPFSEWDYLKVKKHHYNKSMVTMFHSFISDQIKQTIASIKAGAQRVSIIVCNCLDLSARLDVESYRFDRIFTSNIADFSGTQALLKAMKPLLNRANKSSTIITQYYGWYLSVPDSMVYGEITAAQTTLQAPQRVCEISSCAILAAYDINSDYYEDMLSRHPSTMTEECDKVIDTGMFFCQEYFNNMNWFVSYLRAECMAVNKGSQLTKPPSFQKVKQSEGLQLRDFRRGNSNKVVPFRYRRNARPVNMTRGMDRMLEWHFP
ncbi:uncharacterized protein [Amphiura filiformis]|uniref:uncharacterized protein n=1 Tax=Amphiura filiformis TaxID=82378 RepID=UPI003B20CD52